jgi:hypothetical protein
VLLEPITFAETSDRFWVFWLVNSNHREAVLPAVASAVISNAVSGMWDLPSPMFDGL